jgi:hypothetical protein
MRKEKEKLGRDKEGGEEREVRMRKGRGEVGNGQGRRDKREGVGSWGAQIRKC